MKYLLALVICCSLLGCGGESANISGSCADLFGDMRFSDLDGRQAQLPCAGDAVLVVNLWATWCGPCRLEIPQLAEIAGEYKGRGVQVVGICLDQVLPSSLKPAVAGFGITYPVLMGSAEKIFERTGIDSVPTTIIIAPGGRIDKVLMGYHSKKELLAHVDGLLKKKESN